jgi:hypothetical protein
VLLSVTEGLHEEVEVEAVCEAAELAQLANLLTEISPVEIQLSKSKLN